MIDFINFANTVFIFLFLERLVRFVELILKELARLIKVLHMFGLYLKVLKLHFHGEDKS